MFDIEKQIHKLSTIKFSLKYPLNNNNSKYARFKPILIGLLLSIGAFLIIPAFTLNGYIFKLKEHAAKGKNQPPEYKNYVELTKEGFFAAIAMMIPVLVLFLVVIVSYNFLNTANALLVALAGSLILITILPIFGVVYAVKRNIIRTYTDKDAYEIIFSKYLLIGFLKYILLGIILFVVLLVGSVVTLGIGALLLQPYIVYVRPSFWGKVCYEWKNSN